MDDLNQLTTVELQKILKDNGLPIYCQKKKDLIQRLVSAGLHSFNSKSRHNSASSSKSEDSVFLDLPEEKGKVTEQDLNSNLSEELIEKEINKKISVMTTEASIFSFKDIEESLEVFNGESGVDIISWLKEFEQIATVCNWGPVHKYLYSRRLLRGAARLAVEGSEQCNDFEELKQVLKSEFGSATSSLNIHRSLEARKKNSSESYLEYVFAMKQLASRGSIDERSLVSYIIQGIPDNPLNKSILYEATTICDLKKKLEAYKMMKEQMSTKSLSKHMSQSTFETKEKSGKSRCTNCGALSHSLIQCPHRSKGSRCFKCGEFGHIRAMCSKPESVTNNDKRSPEVNLIQLPLVKVNIANLQFQALVDTGSDVTLLKTSVYEKIKNVTSNDGPGTVFLGFGKSSFRSSRSTTVWVEINGQKFELICHVVPDNWLRWEFLIGRNILKEASVTITSQSVQIEKLCPIKEEEEDFINQLDVLALTSVDECPSLAEVASKDLRKELENLIQNYVPQNPNKSLVKMKIYLEDETPVYQKPRRLPPAERQIVREQIEEWLREGIIQHSCSDFASPIVLVRKSDGSPRLCVDFRKLNRKVIKDRYPLPIIEEVIEGLHKAKVFTTLDLKNGFFHVDIEESSRKYTSFVTNDGQYEFLKVPFGLCNSPSVFQRYINTVFRDLIKDQILLVYMDDLIIPSPNEIENIKSLKRVLNVAADNGLIIKWSKCRLLKKKIEFLGHIIENGCVRPSEEKIKSVANFPEPKSVKNVRSFLGLTGFFRKFIAGYAAIARPLTELTKKDNSFKFGSVEREAFETLKAHLCQEPVLKLFNPELETQLHTDASSIGFGAVLLQKHDDGYLHPVFYLSYKTTTIEKRYTSYELECLAIVKTLLRLRYYLLGLSFKIFTDCKAFQQTMQKKELCARIARWALIIEEFDCSIHHRPGTKMLHVDALSRHPIVQIIEKDFLHQIKQSQQQDEFCRILITILKSGSSDDNYSLRNDLLYRFEEGNFLLVVPKGLQQDLIKSIHEQGHINARKVQVLLKRDYYFSNMAKQIEKVIRNCVPCILVSRKEGKKEGIFNMIDKHDVPLHTYHLDHLGPLATTAKKYKYILAIIDAFTKFSWLFPVKDTSAEEVIKKLGVISDIFGNPVRIITDRGAAFSSNAFKSYCETENIQHHMVTTGVPRGNGQVERLNRIVVTTLAKMTVKDPTKWYKYVSDLQRFLNSTINRSTNKTPFELLIGVPMKKPEDLELSKLIEESIIEQFEDDRNNLRREAKEAITKIQLENRKYSLRKRKPATQYHLHDLVVVKKTQFSPNTKLFPKFMGPYEIVKVLGKDRYHLQKVGNHEGPNSTSSSADHLKHWRGVEEEDGESSGSDDMQDGRL